jgi:hypothetical protein
VKDVRDILKVHHLVVIMTMNDSELTLLIDRTQGQFNITSHPSAFQPFGACFLLWKNYKLHGRPNAMTNISLCTHLRSPMGLQNCKSTIRASTRSLAMCSRYVRLILLSPSNLPNLRLTVLHPYYKLDYMEMAWGGAEEQAKEIKAGNKHAKNWQDEAKKVVEVMVRNTIV